MENIFAKPPASPSHHYALLLQKKDINSQNFKNQFSNTLPTPIHLYSAMGLSKGHRKAVSNQRQSPDIQIHEAFTEPIRKPLDDAAISVSEENDWLRSQLEVERKNNFKLQVKIQELEEELRAEKEKNLKLSKGI
jgi:hypothetical protein